MKVVDTWPTEQHEDSAPGDLEQLSVAAHLRLLTGGGSAYPVDVAGLSIGREGCDVIIDDDIRISRKHARIERSIAGWQFQDLGSRNGFYLNGKGFGAGDRVPLPDGGVLRIGDSLMVFRAVQLPDAAGADSPVFPGVSPQAVGVRQRIAALASTPGHVLILGETGTGKESVAKALGDQRAPHPFVTLNCAQLSRELARSELFGHLRGSFTNAHHTKPGLVDLAGEGALFLDEIGELPFDVQAELLRFLEDGSYRPLGSTELRRSEARVVAATNVDLDQAVYHSKFRRDLLARLRASNAPLELPALRERREDIPGWTQLFFRQLGRDPGPKAWTAGALECLLLYPWSENLRQLLGTVRHAAGQSADFPCSPEHLPPALRTHRNSLRGNPSRPADEPTPQHTPKPARRNDPSEVEILAALHETEGNVRRAALLLGIDRRKLYRLCERFGIALEELRADTNREEDE